MLEYESKLAPHEQVIIRNCLRANKPLPAKIANAPIIEEGTEFYYIAYLDLSTTRHYELGPIPFNQVALYGNIYGLEVDEIDFLWQVIRDVDSWALAEVIKEIKSKNGNKNAGKNPK